MNKKLIIFGSGDIGQIAKHYFDTDSDHKPVCFTVDSAYLKESSIEGIPVVAFEEVEKSFDPKDHDMFIALVYNEMNKARARKYNEAKGKGYKLTSYVSSKSMYVSQHSHGDNCFIFEGAVVQPFARVGNNVTLWSGCYIGHHATIEDHNFIGSHAAVSGHCHVESYCFLGANSTINHKVKIASETLVGAGAVITKDTTFQSVWAPARSVQLEKKSHAFKL